LLGELIGGFRRRHPDTEIRLSLGRLAQSYGESIDLTLYRCVQEGVTNAIRHGSAEHLYIDLIEERRSPDGGGRPAPTLRLTLRDDGKGIASSTPKGFGLTTMTERIRSLGGSCAVESALSKGTTIIALIPVQRIAERTRALELVGGIN
jgi:two-component system sensor histidine kinase UhpB